MSARALVSQKATYTIQEAATVDIFFQTATLLSASGLSSSEALCQAPSAGSWHFNFILIRTILIVFQIVLNSCLAFN